VIVAVTGRPRYAYDAIAPSPSSPSRETSATSAAHRGHDRGSPTSFQTSVVGVAMRTDSVLRITVPFSQMQNRFAA